jgi:hypothetical protein
VSALYAVFKGAREAMAIIPVSARRPTLVADRQGRTRIGRPALLALSRGSAEVLYGTTPRLGNRPAFASVAQRVEPKVTIVLNDRSLDTCLTSWSPRCHARNAA